MEQKGAFVDCHTHSCFSADSTTPLERAVACAQKQGLLGVAVTDHLDLGHDNPEENMSFDFAQRALLLTQLQKQAQNSLEILNGVEVGFQPHIIPDITAIIKNNPFDVVICSVHAVNRIFVSDKAFYEGKTKQQAYNDYLEAIYASIATFDEFDIVGHIGYACRYAPYNDTSLRYSDHANILDAILKKMIEKDKALEINTAGFAYKLQYTHPDFDVVTRYKELGGSLITLGSDAHEGERIGAHFDTIVANLKRIGFSHVTHFKNRMPVLTPILK